MLARSSAKQGMIDDQDHMDETSSGQRTMHSFAMHTRAWKIDKTIYSRRRKGNLIAHGPKETAILPFCRLSKCRSLLQTTGWSEAGWWDRETRPQTGASTCILLCPVALHEAGSGSRPWSCESLSYFRVLPKSESEEREEGDGGLRMRRR